MPTYPKWMRSALIRAGLLVCAVAVIPERAAASWLTRTWQTDEGLPDNSVTGVAQSNDGYLWVATLGGLMRFNGANFEEYPVVQLPGTTNRVVRRFHLDRSGRLWLAMASGGVIRVDERAARAFTSSDGLLDRRVTAMAEDRNGTMWLAGTSEFYKIQGETLSRFTTIEGVPQNGGPLVTADTRGDLWFGRGKHVGVVQGDKWRVLQTLDESALGFCAAASGGIWIGTATQLLRLTEDGKLEPHARMPSSLNIRAMLEDQSGAVWIGTSTDGVLRVHEGVVESIPVSHPEITCLKQDHEGNFWVGTAGGGLNLIRPYAMELEGTAAGLPFPSVRSVCEDTDGSVWAVLQDDTVAHTKSGRWQTVTSDDGWPGGRATCVTANREGGVWVATKDRGLLRWHAGQWQTWSQTEGLPAGSIRSLLHAGNGDLWLSFDAPYRLYRFRNGDFQNMEITAEVHALRALAEGAEGTIWVGTSNGRILRVSGDQLIPEPAIPSKGRLISVRTLHTTPDGALWIGYAGSGLGHLINGNYTHIGSTEGLEDDHLSQILSDDRGRLWLTGNRGLFEVSRADLVAVAEGRADRARFIVHRRGSGLTSFQPVFDNTPGAWRTEKGDLLFATRSGLLRVTPGRLEARPTAPPVMLERVLVDDVEVALLGRWLPLRKPESHNLPDPRQTSPPLFLPPDHRKVEFRFAALSFASPENVHFRYRLEGFDGSWIDSTSQRSATYSRLPAGRYTFEVTACNEAGIWNEQGFRLAFSVRPFFWQTWWFRLTAAAVFTAALIGMVRYLSFRRLRRHLEQLERQAELHRERTRIARDMHDEVGAKLSRLSLLSEMASQPSLAPESFRDEIGEISETARETIRSFEDIVWAVNPRNDSLADLVDYLCRFAEELFDGTSTGCAFDVPAELPAVELPTELRHHLFLAAKEALHNVLKHARASRVWLRVACTDQSLEIVIEDDGCGFCVETQGTGGGNGLGNMRERMRQMQGTFEVQSQQGVGSRVMLRTECPREPGTGRRAGTASL